MELKDLQILTGYNGLTLTDIKERLRLLYTKIRKDMEEVDDLLDQWENIEREHEKKNNEK